MIEAPIQDQSLGGFIRSTDTAGLEKSHTERKADYFASLLLIDQHELITFYNSFENNAETTLHKIFLCMRRFQALFKTILICLYELQLIHYSTIEKYFDQKLDYHKEFEALGIDSYKIERSNVINLAKIEKMMQQYTLPEATQQAIQIVY
ncbi:hypothetical protein QRE66_13320 [Bacillus cereus]|uniref:hypothetical protein n=1 Tax=Bacillus pseudomycoides TaxID=64104 RepID=UPI001FB2AEDE|nr:hypothetical protein [Bacillus pseudomycoides]WJE50385.1 hypothetical protein QRE66_13320 [Bacillus cereus]